MGLLGMSCHVVEVEYISRTWAALTRLCLISTSLPFILKISRKSLSQISIDRENSDYEGCSSRYFSTAGSLILDFHLMEDALFAEHIPSISSSLVPSSRSLLLRPPFQSPLSRDARRKPREGAFYASRCAPPGIIHT